MGVDASDSFTEAAGACRMGCPDPTRNALIAWGILAGSGLLA
jgi:hypothetical protein